MARLRMMPVLALAACGRAEAVPPPPPPRVALKPPPAWQPLGELANAVAETAQHDGVTVASAAAWGERARGCYAVWLDVRGAAAAPDAIADQLLAGLPIDPHLAGIAVHDVVRPAAGADRGTFSLAFERAPYRGRLRAQLTADGEVAALACFWNDREPAACTEGCTALIGSMP